MAFENDKTVVNDKSDIDNNSVDDNEGRIIRVTLSQIYCFDRDNSAKINNRNYDSNGNIYH